MKYPDRDKTSNHMILLVCGMLKIKQTKKKTKPIVRTDWWISEKWFGGEIGEGE